MSEEKSLKMEGEELARIAVDSGMGAKQLQTIYRLVKTKPLAYVQAFVKRQIGRDVKGFAAFMKVLELLEKYEDNKTSFEKVLMYGVMLYDYCEKVPIINLKLTGEPVIKRIVEKHGVRYEGTTMKRRGNSLEITVKTGRFYRNPKALAMEIERALKSKEDFSDLNMKVWIESR